MRIRLILGAILGFLLPTSACDSTKAYPVRFICEPGGPACPQGSECPELPLAADTCGDLPGLFGHPPTPVTVGRPVGCMVLLPYGNPAYGNRQQQCTCETIASSPASSAPRWMCPI